MPLPRAIPNRPFTTHRGIAASLAGGPLALAVLSAAVCLAAAASLHAASGDVEPASTVVQAPADLSAIRREPLLVDGELVYPPDAEIPRNLTPAEAEYLRSNPLGGSRAVTPPPTGPVHCVAEYEPMEGMIISWQGSSSFLTILAKMTASVTTTANSRVYCIVDSVAEQSSATTTMTTWGANLSKVQFVIRTIDTIWVRDYGPRYIYQGDCRAVVDHDYNRPRPNDDVLPSYFAGTVKKHAYYEHALVHGGGNYHLNALNKSFATELIWNENPGLSHTVIHDTWQDYQNVDTHIFPPFPTSIDSTQHIDMWVQVYGDNQVMISDWPFNSGSTQDVICDNAATYFTGLGWTVTRIPARSVSAVHYTYTNVVIMNNVVLVPLYTNASVTQHNTPARDAWAAAMPGKTIVQIDCQAIVPSAGVMHCIMMHVPANKNGVNPEAYLVNLNGGEVLTPGQQVNIQWISDDDVSVSNVDIHLSTDDGATWPRTIAAATADDGSFTWTVPGYFSDRARIRVTARDGTGNLGADSSDASFTINGNPVGPGDMNCDTFIDAADVPYFVQALLDPSAYSLSAPWCDIAQANMNGDASIDADDVAAFAATVIP